MTLMEAIEKQAADRRERYQQLLQLVCNRRDTIGAGVDDLAADITNRLMADGFNLDDFIRDIKLKGIQ